MHKAISLIELLIAMAIVTILAAITVPLLNQLLPSLQFSSTTRAISAKFRQAQEEAVTTQIRHGVRFNLSNPSSVELIKISGGSIIPLESVQIPSTITLSLNFSNPTYQNCITFSSNGAPDVNGYITIAREGASKYIDISPVGTLRILSSPPSTTP